MPTPFGLLPDGTPTQLFVLQNASGFRAEITDYGGAVVRLFAPDRTGRLADVVLGCPDAAAYATHGSFFGCLVGRVGNRIAHGRFTLDGRTYDLARNNTPNGVPCHLHGGVRGFDRYVWAAEPFVSAAGPALRLRHRSPAGDEGYPGNLDVTVVYTVTADSALQIDYTAVADAPTPVNLTNHSFFNLAGEGRGTILDHEAVFRASRYTPVDAGLIPTGELAPVAGTPFDFQTPQRIGARLDAPHEQLRLAGGYDHNFVIDRGPAPLAPAASVYEPSSGRTLDVLTTEPGFQFYTGNFLAGTIAGKTGSAYPWRSGFCLETQHFPDSPNQPAFPSVILRPGRTLTSTTVYRFGTR